MKDVYGQHYLPRNGLAVVVDGELEFLLAFAFDLDLLAAVRLCELDKHVRRLTEAKEALNIPYGS